MKRNIIMIFGLVALVIVGGIVLWAQEDLRTEVVEEDSRTEVVRTHWETIRYHCADGARVEKELPPSTLADAGVRYVHYQDGTTTRTSCGGYPLATEAERKEHSMKCRAMSEYVKRVCVEQ